MLMLRIEILKHPPLKSKVNSVELVKYLLNSLFCIESAGARFKEQKLRKQALGLLEVMCKSFSKEGETIRKYLDDIHCNGSWRTNRREDWKISSGINRSNNFLGLKNLGATCYVNSLIQQLFMIPSFRKQIIEVEHKPINKEDNILYQLQLLFTSLMSSQRIVYNPLSFLKTINIDNRPFNPYEQKDVDEFLIYLFDKLEQELKNTKQEKLIKDTFKLTIANEIICKDCPHRSETLEENLSLILSVKNKRTVYESLNAYVQSDILEGDNAYYCERCDRKVTAFKRQNVKTLPNTLIIVLKRFEFNYETMMRLKVNDYCEFPQELDLEEFTQEGQTIKELNTALELGQISFEDLNDDQKKMLKRKVPSYYYTYKLKGIIVHYGHTDAGHYYSYILDRSNDKNWFEFNDSTVRTFNPKDIPEESFGGEEEVDPELNEAVKREKLKNAYLLIYERVVKLDVDALEKYKKEEREVDADEIPNRFNKMIVEKGEVEIKIPEVLENTISKDNKDFWLTQYIFNPDYLDFVSKLFEKVKTPSSKDYDKAHKELLSLNEHDIGIVSFGVKFILTVGLRAEYKDELPKIMNFIERSCNNNYKVCMWICKLFCYSSIIQEFITDCPYTEPTLWLTQLLQYATTKLYNVEESKLNAITAQASNLMNPKFLSNLLNLPTATSNKIQLHNEPHTAPYLLLIMNTLIQRAGESLSIFKFLCSLASIGNATLKYLHGCSMLGVIFELIKDIKGSCRQLGEKVVTHIEVKGEAPISLRANIEEGKQVKEKFHPGRYLFELVYRLIKSAMFSEIKGRNVNTITQLNSEEDKYVSGLKGDKEIDFLVSLSMGNKVAVNYLADTIAYIYSENKEVTREICKSILNKLPRLDSAFLDPFIRIYSKLDTPKAELHISLYDSFMNIQGNPRLSEATANYRLKHHDKANVRAKIVDDALYKKYPTAQHFLNVNCYHIIG